MEYLISAPTETTWKMDAHEFVSKLTERWPNAKIQRITGNKNFTHSWEIRMSKRILEGEYNQTESGVVLDGEIVDCAAFAVWFRTLVPAEQPLLFYDDSFLTKVQLEPGTAESVIVEAFAQ